MANPVNKFFDTAFGKSVETFLWIAAAYALTAAGGWVAHVHWSAKLIALGVPGLVNWLLYTVKVVFDPLIPNFTNSPQLQLVPNTNPTVVKPTVSGVAQDAAIAAVDTAANELADQLDKQPAAPVAPVAPAAPATPVINDPLAPVS